MTDDAAEKELRRLKSIINIHHSFGASMELEEVCRIAVRELIDLFGCEGCAILSIDGNEVKVLAERGFSRTFGRTEFATEMPAIKYILDTRNAIFTENVARSPASDCVPRGSSIKSLICMPIIVQGDVRGIIHLDSVRKAAFGQEDFEFTELLAKEIAIAMERSFLFAQVKDIAIRDGLTGCFNRRKFDVDIVVGLAEAKQQDRQLSLLMLDIDYFKKYNDQYGHHKGDELLRQLVSILSLNTRPGDTIYRYGGEEFAILLKTASNKIATRVAERLRGLIAGAQFKEEENSRSGSKVSVSIGVATFPEDASNTAQLITAADSALYQAKKNGRNQVCSFVRD